MLHLLLLLHHIHLHLLLLQGPPPLLPLRARVRQPLGQPRPLRMRLDPERQAARRLPDGRGLCSVHRDSSRRR